MAEGDNFEQRWLERTVFMPDELIARSLHHQENDQTVLSFMGRIRDGWGMYILLNSGTPEHIAETTFKPKLASDMTNKTLYVARYKMAFEVGLAVEDIFNESHKSRIALQISPEDQQEARQVAELSDYKTLPQISLLGLRAYCLRHEIPNAISF